MMDIRPVAGILLPVYRNDIPDFFTMSVRSILNQTYENIVVYIGVDGPVDAPLRDVISAYGQHEKVRVVYFAENRGLAAVLNDLITMCRRDGIEFMARMDADDISVPDRIEAQIDCLLQNPEIDVLGGNIEEIDQNSEPLGKTVVYPTSHRQCRAFFRYRDPLAHPAVMFRSSFFDKLGHCYRPQYRKNQDTMLWFDGFQAGCVFANLNKTILCFRVTQDFYMRRNGWKRASKMLKDRFLINKTLKYDISAYLFAVAMFVITLCPPAVKKFFYKIR